jgi:Na+/proline symporter
VSKLVTGFWGCRVHRRVYATNLGPLIDVVNRFGSFFYGSLLGVFVLAVGAKRATSRGAFWGLLAGMAAVALVARYSSIAFLWHNVVGCAAVVTVGSIVSLLVDRPLRGHVAGIARSEPGGSAIPATCRLPRKTVGTAPAWGERRKGH